MIRIVALFLLAALVPLAPVGAQDNREILEVEIEAGIDEVWRAFTTTEGLKLWVAPLVEIDFKVGGKWLSNYNSQGKIGDATTIENTILCYDPKRMISLKATKFPEGFPFVEAAKETWSVFYFSPITSSRTKITLVGLGYTDSEQSQQMRSFFAVANKQSLDKLNDALKSQPKQDSPE